MSIYASVRQQRWRPRWVSSLCLLVCMLVAPSVWAEADFRQQQYTFSEGDGRVRLDIARRPNSVGELRMHFRVVSKGDNAAIYKEDFFPIDGDDNIVIGRGESTASVSFDIEDDAVFEDDEEFVVELWSGFISSDNANSIRYASTRVLLLDNDEESTPGRAEPEDLEYTVREDAGVVRIGVRRVGGDDGELRANYYTAEADSNNSAKADADFETREGTLRWSAGDTATQYIEIPILQDQEQEATESFEVSVSDGCCEEQFVRVAILDVSPEPGRLRFRNTTVSAREDAGEVALVVERVGGADGEVSVSYATGADADSAIGGQDYTTTSATLRWPNGDTSPKTLRIPVLEDARSESNEFFSVRLSGVTGGAALEGSATARVTLEDTTRFGRLRFTQSDYLGREDAGTISVTVSREEGANGDVSVRVTSADVGEAVVGQDYTRVDRELRWADGDTQDKTVSVRVAADDVREDNESLSLTLSEVSGGAELGDPASATVTIEDSTAPRRGDIGFAQSALTVAEGGAVQLRVQRQGGEDGAVAVRYQVGREGDSAVADEDFSSAAYEGELRWDDFDTGERVIDVSILVDNATEGEERFTVALSDPSGGANLSANSVATVTINDVIPDDFRPVLDIVSGDEQAGFPGTTLEPFVISVTSESAGAAGVPVTWRVDPPDAGRLIEGTSTTSDDDAVASNRLEILKGGVLTVTAQVEGTAVANDDDDNPSRVRFTVNAGFSGSPILDDNQRAVGSALDGACPALASADNLSAEQQDLLATCQDLEAATSEERAAGLSRLMPEEAFAVGPASLDAADIQVSNIQSRLQAIRQGSSGLALDALSLELYGQQMPSVVTTAIAELMTGSSGGGAGETGERLGVFINGAISVGEHDASTREQGVEIATQGVTIGVDYRTDGDWVVGAALGFIAQRSDFDVDDGRIDVNGANLSAFASWYADDTAYLDAIVTVGQHQFDIKRRVNLADQPEQFANAESDASELALSLGGGMVFHRGSWQFGPYGRLAYSQARVDGYTETASNPDGPGQGSVLDVKAQTLDYSEVVLGGEASYPISTASGVWIPQLRLEAAHRLDDGERDVEAAFAYDPTATGFTITSDSVDTDYLNLSTGVSATFRNGKSLYLMYETRLGQERVSQYWLRAGFRLMF